MTDGPVVSVIMNCYNSDAYLKEAIQSVVDQTFKNWEIIFWDNQSTDQSAEIAASFNDNRIKYYYAAEHTSLGAARNLAFDKCAGTYVAFLDCDDTWLTDKLEKQVRLFKARPDVDFIYANYYVQDMIKKKSTPAIKRVQPEGNIFEHLLYEYSIGILTVMVRIERLNELDALFDLNLSLAEDYELFMRILFTSKAAYIHDFLASYRIHATNISFSRQRDWVKEFTYVIRKFRELDTEKRYVKGLEHLEKENVVRDAIINAVQGELHQARGLMQPLKYDNLKNIAFYLITFLPVPVWFLLRPLWGRRWFYR